MRPTLLVVASNPPESYPVVRSLALHPLKALILPTELLGSLPRPAVTALLRELAFAVAELTRGEKERAVVPIESLGISAEDRKQAAPGHWNLGLERDGRNLLVSVYRQGVRAEVLQTERPVELAAARRAVLDAIEQHQAGEERAGRESNATAPLSMAKRKLSDCLVTATVESYPTQRTRTQLKPATEGLRLWADVVVRRGRRAGKSELLRADLHPLLFRGTLGVTLAMSERKLDNVHVFLCIEALVSLAHDVLDARSEGRGMLRRLSAGSAQCGVQLSRNGAATLLLARHGKERTAWRCPPVSYRALALAIADIATTMHSRVLELDPSQNNNLRLSTLAEATRDLHERLRADESPQSLLNASPESYKAFAESHEAETPTPVPITTSRSGRLRFSESWRADVPGIDLRALQLCGERLVVSAQRELAAIDRRSGQMLWSQGVRRGITIVTGAGLVRLAPSGQLDLFDLMDGEELFRVRLGPCSGARASGALVQAPGLPNLLLLAEGEDKLSAVDLDSGEVRWRRKMRRSGQIRICLAGKLAIAAAGENELVAIDVLSGEIVWRLCSTQRFSRRPIAVGSELFAVSVRRPGHRGEALLHCLDAWSGEERWRVALPRPASPVSLVATSEVVALISNDSEGRNYRTGLLAFDRKDGSLRYDRNGGLCSGAAGRLMIDDVLVANSELGELVAVNLNDGSLRYRHVFASGRVTADRPQSMQPILRSGALFLPQSEIFVVRPQDGTVLGRVPSELVPDSLRVDEQCGVYVAESSGYLAAYHALPALQLVPV